MNFDYSSVVAVISLILLVIACVEVGSNDAANLVNAVFGARVMDRHRAVWIAGIFVVLGSTLASPVMETVRKGIFDPTALSAADAMTVFVTSYIVNTVLLFAYSAYGMPVSTTATLVFSLAGGAFGVSRGWEVVNLTTLLKVIFAIAISILMSGTAAFLLQRVFRGAIRKHCEDPLLVRLHGPWISGLMMTFLSWFMVVKGMKSLFHSSDVEHLLSGSLGDFAAPGLLMGLWMCFTVATHLILKALGPMAEKNLFKATAIIGMACMAFAFGQNDLANCAAPGLANIMTHWGGGNVASDVTIPTWVLFGCGLLMFAGMRTRRAQRVTRAEVNTASQQNDVNLYAPQWCRAVARRLVGTGDVTSDVAPAADRDEAGKKLHYDALRASVILAVSASIIALASSLGLPVSTTYVAFAAVVATGWGDRVFDRGRADVKLGRAIWVVVGWIMGGVLASSACAILGFLISLVGTPALVVGLALNLGVRFWSARAAETHEARYHTHG